MCVSYLEPFKGFQLHLRIKPFIMACKGPYNMASAYLSNLVIVLNNYRGPQRGQVLSQCGTWHRLYPRSSSFPLSLHLHFRSRPKYNILRKADHDSSPQFNSRLYSNSTIDFFSFTALLHDSHL